MEMRKCDKGHYYDASMHASCPYCGGGRNTEKTMAMGMPAPAPQMQPPAAPSAPAPGGSYGGAWAGGNGTEKTVAMGMTPPPAMGGSGIEPTIPLGQPIPSSPSPAPANDGKTIAMISTEYGVDPVVGWLVRLNGKDKGTDYRIHSDNNFIGRSEKMDIAIKGDETISRDNQAILTYDSQEKLFYFSPSEGRSVVRVNGKAILQTVELKAYDRLTIGKTELMFVPLCGEKFEWENEGQA